MPQIYPGLNWQYKKNLFANKPIEITLCSCVLPWEEQQMSQFITNPKSTKLAPLGF